MKLFFKILANAVWILLLLTIIFPIGWFAWRMGQPMDMPEYNGLTYYQFVSWRKNTLHEMADSGDCFDLEAQACGKVLGLTWEAPTRLWFYVLPA
jgi:hypothetical protein